MLLACQSRSVKAPEPASLVVSQAAEIAVLLVLQAVLLSMIAAIGLAST